MDEEDINEINQALEMHQPSQMVSPDSSKTVPKKSSEPKQTSTSSSQAPSKSVPVQMDSKLSDISQVKPVEPEMEENRLFGSVPGQAEVRWTDAGQRYRRRRNIQ